MLVIAGFLHTPTDAPDGGLRLDILSESVGGTEPASRSALNDPYQVTPHDDGTISITTVGYRDCPVLPTRIEESADAAVIILGPVPNALACGRALQTFTTVVQVAGLEHRQALTVSSGAPGT